MPRFLLESYVAATPASFEESRKRARRVSKVKPGVRYLSTTSLPGDVTVLHLFEALSAEAVSEAGRLAESPFDRMMEAIEGSAESLEKKEVRWAHLYADRRTAWQGVLARPRWSPSSHPAPILASIAPTPPRASITSTSSWRSRVLSAHRLRHAYDCKLAHGGIAGYRDGARRPF